MLYITCPSCGKSFQVDDDYYTYLQSQGATPVLFCSRACEEQGWHPSAFDFRPSPVMMQQTQRQQRQDGCGKEISAREQMLEEAEVRKHAR